MQHRVLVYETPWNRQTGRCEIEILDEAKIIIVTEMADNPGPSITNSIEYVGQAILSQFNIDLRSDEWTLIEHYEPNSIRGHTWDQVSFGERWAPSWKHLGEEGMAELLLDFPWLQV